MTEKNALRLITTANLLLLAMTISNICAHLTQPGFLLPSATIARGADIALNVLLLPLVAIVSYFLVVNDRRVRRGEAKRCPARFEDLSITLVLCFIPSWLAGFGVHRLLLAPLQLAFDAVVICRCLRALRSSTSRQGEPVRVEPPAHPVSAKTNRLLLACGHALLLAAFLTCIPAQLVRADIWPAQTDIHAANTAHAALLLLLAPFLLWLYLARARLPLPYGEQAGVLALFFAILLLMLSPATTTPKEGFAWLSLLLTVSLPCCLLLGAIRRFRQTPPAAA
jgi:membrane protein